MGGDLIQIESNNYDTFKKNEVLWPIFERVNFTSYMKAMKGYDSSLSSQYAHSWKDGRVLILGVPFTVPMKLNLGVTLFPIDGVAFPKKPKGNYKEDFKKFLVHGEKLCRLQNGFNIEDLLGE